jgi:hypothetical protein
MTAWARLIGSSRRQLFMYPNALDMHERKRRRDGLKEMVSRLCVGIYERCVCVLHVCLEKSNRHGDDPRDLVPDLHYLTME